MTKIQEIEQAISQLPRDEFFQLVRNLRQRHPAEWDRQIEADSDSGALDFLLREVEDDMAQGRTHPTDELCDNS